MNKKWYQKKLNIILLILIFPLVGLFLFVKYYPTSIKTKKYTLILMLIISIAYVIDNNAWDMFLIFTIPLIFYMMYFIIKYQKSNILPDIPSVLDKLALHKGNHLQMIIPQYYKLDVITDILNEIPQSRHSLLYFSNQDAKDIKMYSGSYYGVNISIDEDGGHVSEVKTDEPSTIYTKLCVQIPTNNIVGDIGYYPCYKLLTDQQKWIYLNWLKDVTQRIEIGYVFIYYYGLERRLLTDSFSAAFDEIVLLRKYHHHPSFLSYSINALIASCIIKNSPQKIENLLDVNDIGIDINIYLLLLYRLHRNLDNAILMRIANALHQNEINKRYIKLYPEMYEGNLQSILISKYNKNYLPFFDTYNIKELPHVKTIFFANYSLPDAIRFINIPTFISRGKFHKDVLEIFRLTHEKVKIDLREMRLNKKG